MSELESYPGINKIIGVLITEQMRIVSKLQHEISDKDNLLEGESLEYYSDRLAEFINNLGFLVNIKLQLNQSDE